MEQDAHLCRCRAGLFGGGSFEFHFPTGIATDGSGDVFVTDNANNRIDEFASAR